MSTKRREYEYGQIVSVDVVPLGDNLAADVSAGASSITVEDASDFDEDGGSLLLAGTVYAYSTWTEDDATGVGTISLTGATLAANAFEGDAVAVYDPLYLVAASDKVAQIAVVGDDGNVDMLEAAIALHLVDKIDEGVRGTQGEQVKLELEGDEWVVVDIQGLGDPDSSGTLFMQDALTTTATGAQSLTLTYEPITNSEHLYWNGLYQPGSEWTRAGKVVSVADSPAGSIAVGDQLVMEYAYRKPSNRPDIGSSPLDIPGLYIWYSAEYEARNYADGEQMTGWTDLSGNNFHATGAAYSGAMPLWKAAQGPSSAGPAVRFNDGYFDLPQTAFGGPGAPGTLTAGEIFINVKADSQTSSTSLHFLNDCGASPEQHYCYGDGALYDNFGSTTRRSAGSPPTITAWRRYNAWSAANDWAVRLDETTYLSDSSNTVGFGLTNRWQLGLGYVTPGPFKGVMTAVLFWPRKLTTTERAAVIAWMQANPYGGHL